LKKKRNSQKQAKNTGKFYFDPLFGERVASDSVLTTEVPGQGKGSREWEFGANAIVGTFDVILNSVDPERVNNVNRDLLIGDFRYSKSGAISGRIDYIIGGDYLPDAGEETVVVSRVNGVNTFRDYRGSQTIILRENSIDRPFFYVSNASPQNIAANAAIGINIVTDKSGLAAYGVSSFFAGEWWKDPFAPNLI
jgi:hypothetical protein